MNWHPNRVQVILMLAIFIAGIVTLVSIPLDRSLTTFRIAGRVGLFLVGVFSIYTGYSDQGKTPEEKSLLSRSQKSLIGSGVMIILFVILISLTSNF